MPLSYWEILYAICRSLSEMITNSKNILIARNGVTLMQNEYGVGVGAETAAFEKILNVLRIIYPIVMYIIVQTITLNEYLEVWAQATGKPLHKHSHGEHFTSDDFKGSWRRVCTFSLQINNLKPRQWSKRISNLKLV